MEGRLRRPRHTVRQRFPVMTDLADRVLAANVLDAGTRLAAQAFLVSVPLLFAVAAFAPQSVREEFLRSLSAMFGLTGTSQTELQQVLSDPAGKSLHQTTGVLGLLLTLLSATSFSRAMARVCERAWRLPRAGARVAAWRWVVWLLLLVAVTLLQAPVRDGFGVGLWLGTPLLFLVATGLWLLTQHLLLAGRVPWRRLLPGALLTAAATTALNVTARLYIPGALDRALAEYGSLGMVLTVLSWLIVVCVAISLTVTVGAVLVTSPPLHRLWRKG